MTKATLILNLFLIVLTGSLFASNDTRSDSTDILHYQIDLSIRNLSLKTISGSTTITLRSKVNQKNYEIFDLLNMQVQSVVADDSIAQFEYNGKRLKVFLNKPLNINDTSRITIHYNGQPATDSKWGGFYFNGNYAFNMGVGFDANPHNFGRCWFPCFDNFVERSTVTCHITTDSGFRAVCGGLPLPETTHPDGSVTWRWQLNQQVPSYLISVAVGKYTLVNQSHLLPVTTYLAVEPKDTANLKASFINLNKAYEQFVSLFGPYRFDRIGFVGVPFNAGAMEHATNIAYPLYAINGGLANETLMAHEFAHHWWGDLVTCRTAEDMWINEGWASYCEALYLEFVYGKQAYLNDIRAKNLYVQRFAHVRDSGFRAVSGVPHAFTYGDHVYKKGALVMHNLRTYMGDSNFFAACRQFLSDYAFKDVSTADFMNTFAKYGDSLAITQFFNNWINNPGFSAFKICSINPQPSGSAWQIKIGVYQLQRQAPALFKNIPFSITMSNGNTIQRQSFIFKGNGSNYEEFVFTTNNNPAGDWMYTINAETDLADGLTRAIDTIVSTGLRSYPDALISLTNQTIPAASKPIINLEHYWTRADQFYCDIPGLYVSNYRHWKVGGLWPAGFKTEAFLNYDATTSSLSGGFLDHTLFGQSEDSLVLLWRPDCNAKWQIMTDPTAIKQTGGSVTDKVGRFWIKDLKQGEYTFACYNKNLTSVPRNLRGESKVKQFLIVPNPSDAQISIKSNNRLQPDYIGIYNQQGALVSETRVSDLNPVLDIGKLVNGSYNVEIRAGTYSEVHQLLVSKP